MLWLRKPSVEMAIPAAMKRAPDGPRAMRMTHDAGVGIFASPSAPRTPTQTMFTAT